MWDVEGLTGVLPQTLQSEKQQVTSLHVTFAESPPNWELYFSTRSPTLCPKEYSVFSSLRALAPTPPLICSNLPSAWSPQTGHFWAPMAKTFRSPKLPPSLHLRPGISVLKVPCSSGVLARTMAQLLFTDVSASGNRNRIKVWGTHSVLPRTLTPSC